MSVLLVDIGNTRVKWAVLRGTRITRARARAHGGNTAALQAVVRNSARDVNRVVAVCVAGTRLERALSAAARARFGVRTEFIRSQRQAAGVRNAYLDTWRLGADRWVAVIAAHEIAKRRPVLVANIGTALTLDAVTADGRHIGGALAPGPTTMIASLLAGTQGIRRRAVGARPAARRSRRLFADDTAGALEAGAAHAAAALIERAAAAARAELGTRPLLLLTGGGAPRLSIYISTPFRLVPDLVLQGLALLARSPM